MVGTVRGEGHARKTRCRCPIVRTECPPQVSTLLNGPASIGSARQAGVPALFHHRTVLADDLKEAKALLEELNS